MRRKIIAIAAAAALAVTGFGGTPAQARDRGETEAIVAGAAALAIVGATLASDRNRDRRHIGQVSRGYDHRHGYYAPPRYRGYYGAPRHRGYYAAPRHRGHYGPHRHRGYRDHGYRAHHRHDYGYGRDNAGNRYRHDGR